MTSDYSRALDTAEQMLGFRLERFLGPSPGEPENSADFKRIATVHAFGDAWPRTEHLDTRTRAPISITIAASLGVLEPLRGQLRIALNNGVTPDEIVEAFIQIAVYAGVARAFESYGVAAEVFAEMAGQSEGQRPAQERRRRRGRGTAADEPLAPFHTVAMTLLYGDIGALQTSRGLPDRSAVAAAHLPAGAARPVSHFPLSCGSTARPRPYGRAALR